jgi:predicted phage replisome organizer
MADVGWVRLSTGLFDHPKIKILEMNKNGDTFVSLWLRLLCLAGRANDNGMVYVTEGVAYTPDILAAMTGKDVEVITEALELFRKLNMIAVNEEGYIKILGWEKHQNIEGLAKIRTQTNERVKRYREKKKKTCNDDVTNDVTSRNVTCNDDVTLRNATEKRREEKNRKEKDDYHHPKRNDDDEEKTHTEIFALWEKNMMPLTPIVGEKLQALLGEVGEVAVEQGILAAVEHGARNFAYVQTVARNYVSGNSKKQNAGAGYSSMDLVNELYGGEEDAATAENSPNDC